MFKFFLQFSYHFTSLRLGNMVQLGMKKTELAYLAGIIDGDGFISIRPVNNTRKIAIHIGVVSTDLPLLEWIVERFGGYVYHRPAPKKKPHWKTKYEWRLQHQHIVPVLKSIMPYLIIKKEHARLAIKFRETYRCIYRPLPDSIYQKRLAIAGEISDLNYARKAKPRKHFSP